MNLSDLKFNKTMENSKPKQAAFFLGLIFNLAAVVLAYFCLVCLFYKWSGRAVFLSFFFVCGAGSVICYLMLRKANNIKTVMFYYWLAFFISLIAAGFVLNYIIGLLILGLSLILTAVILFIFKNGRKVSKKRKEENYYQTILLTEENYDIIKTHNLFNAMKTKRTASISERYKTIRNLYLKIIFLMLAGGLAVIGYLLLTGYLFNGFIFGVNMLMLGLLLISCFFMVNSLFIIKEQKINKDITKIADNTEYDTGNKSGVAENE